MLNIFCSSLLARVPTVFFSLYVRASILFNQALTQTNRTKKAIINSFKNEKIYFLKDSKNIAVHAIFFLSIVDYSDLYIWHFIPSDNLFIEKDYDGPLKKCPWLSAELYYEDTLIEDITEWLDKLRFNSISMPPVSCLVQAWALKNNYQLEQLKGYRIKILNELMEEEIRG